MSDIEEHRKKIEEITLEMIKLLKTRTDIAKQIGDAKASLGMTVTDEEREDALRTQVTKLCKEIDLDQSTALKFLNFLFNESVKVQSDGKQTHLSVFLKAKALEEEGKEIIHLEVGEPDFKPPKEVKTALEEVYDKGYGKYGPAKGMTELRAALTRHRPMNTRISSGGHVITEENIMICPGARFGVYLAITTLLNPGDEIIVIEPAWPAYKDCALNAGIKVRTIKTTLETKWEPSIIDKMSKLQALSLTNISEPIQYVALQALKADTSENTEIIKSRLSALKESAKNIQLEFIEPDGAMYLFTKTKYKDFDATKFSEKLLEHGVAIAPGEGFGDYKEFFRLTAIDETKLKEGMIILDTILKELYG